MEEVKVITKDEAFKRGYLQHKKVYLKPIVRGGRMITQPEHVAYFQFEGASNWFQLAQNDRGELINPFVSDDEKRFFENELGLDLNVNKPKEGNFWRKFFVKVVKDYNLMHNGYEFDLSNPMDVLRYKVMQHQESVASKQEEAYKRPEYRFALVDEGYEEKKQIDTSDKLIEAYTYFGTIKHSIPKMKEFLGMYFNEKKEFKIVPEEAEQSWLQGEIEKIIKSDIDTVLRMLHDTDAPVKLLILNAIRAGAIVKEAKNKYNMLGEGVSYTIEELVPYLKKEEEIKSDIYLKILAQTKKFKK